MIKRMSNEVGEGLVRSLEPATEKTSLFLTKISSFSGGLSCLDVLIVSQNAGKRKQVDWQLKAVDGFKTKNMNNFLRDNIKAENCVDK